jgi:hypothetical protein
MDDHLLSANFEHLFKDSTELLKIKLVVCMSSLRPHPKSLSQAWERDFEAFLPFSQTWEKGLGDEGECGNLQK